jgi:hypothetical protein
MTIEIRQENRQTDKKFLLTLTCACATLNKRQVTGPFFLLSFFERINEGRKIIIGGVKPCVQG